MNVGIESMSVSGGSAVVDVAALTRHRGLDEGRVGNLLMKEKSVALPFEDPVTFGVDAAAPIVDRLSAAEKGRIELLITCTESAFDFSKSLSTYLHEQLGLGRHCRMLEIKQACYAGTAGLQTAAHFILSQTSPGAMALVVASDISRFILEKGADPSAKDWSYAEPSGGAGAVAMLVSAAPRIFELDVGASGYYGYQVMDTCRPGPENEAGDPDLSLLSYLDCCEKAYLEYQRRVADADYRRSFHYLAFHTPFGGMVRGAHRAMMRKVAKAPPEEIAGDFERRVVPGLAYCRRVGNIMGGSLYLSLASTLSRGDFAQARRIGCFSYGSGCCSEFFSGTAGPEGVAELRAMDIEGRLDRRYALSMREYDALLEESGHVRFGTRHAETNLDLMPRIRAAGGGRRLILKAIDNYHRKYEWVE